MLGRYVDLGNPVADHPLNRGLVAWWLPLPNNQGGGTLFDLCALSHGTLTNGPAWSPRATRPGGKYALTFDGSDDHVSVPSHARLMPANLTVSAWIYPTSWMTSFVAVACKQDDNAGAGYPSYDLRRANAANNTIEAAVSIGGSEVKANSAADVVTNAWQHVALSYDGAGLTAYLDGVPGPTTGASGSVGTSTNALNIGRSPSFGGRAFAGSIDDVRLWGRGLSAAEVRAVREDSVRGHPLTLRRFSRKTYLLGETTPGGGGTEDAAGTSAGTAAAAATGASTAAAAASSAGTATAAATGFATAAASAASDGTSTAAATGTSSAAAVASSAGTATAAATGTSTAEAVGTSDGTAAAAATGAAAAAAAGTSAGTSTAAGFADSGGFTVGTSAGTSTAAAVGISTALAAGTSSGTSTAAAVSPSALIDVPEGVGSFDVVSRDGSSDTMTVSGGSADVIDYGIPG